MSKSLLHSEKGSVMLEFCLVLPIYLLIFGGTFLLFDISMGRLHLQESNRNLAWLQDDRYNDAEQLINKELYKRATAFYDARNKLENSFSPYAGNVWSFGPKTTVTDSNGNEVEEYKWGHNISKFEEKDVCLEESNNWAGNLGLGGLLNNDYLKFYSGNMGLQMDKVSAAYIGAVGVASVLFPLNNSSGQETVPLYKAAYRFTRALEVKDDKQTIAQANGEMLVFRRINNLERDRVYNVNNLVFQNIIFRSWPSNGPLGNIFLFLGEDFK